MLEAITQALPFIFAVVFYVATISCFLDIAKWLDKRRNKRLARLAYAPVLLPMIRRIMPSVIAYDLCGVQPMVGPPDNVFTLGWKFMAPVQLDMFQAELDEINRQKFDEALKSVYGTIGGQPHQFELFPEEGEHDGPWITCQYK